MNEGCKKVKIEKEAFGHLSLNTITQIFDVLCEYGHPKYHALVSKFRKERRECVDDFDKRIKLSNTYAKEFNKLFEDLQKDLLENLGILQETLMLSIEAHAKTDPRVVYVFQMLTEKMRMMRAGNKYIHKETLKSILEFKKDFTIQNLDKIRKIAENYKSDRSSIESLLMDFTSYIYDEIQKLYGYEEEDLVTILQSNEVQFDMEINSILIENDNIMKSLTQNIFASLDTVKEDSKNDKKEIANEAIENSVENKVESKEETKNA